MKRSIDTGIWSDAKTERLSSLAKLLWLYLLTAPLGNLAGCFELTARRIEVDTGMKAAQVKKAFDELCDAGLVAFCEETSEVLIFHWHKHNWSSSPKLKKPLIAAIGKVKQNEFRDYLIGVFESRFGDEFPDYAKRTDTEPIPYTYHPISISKSIPKSKPTTTDNKEELTGSNKGRHGVGSNVLLSDDELEKLKSRFPNDWERRIDDLSCYIGSKGDRYKSHYLTILNWARKDAPKEVDHADVYDSAW